MDYQSTYSGPQIDRAVRRSLKSRPGEFKVVAGRRVPLESWGEGVTRFFYDALTFCITSDRLIPTDDENVRRFHSGVVGMLYRSGLVSSFVRVATPDGDYECDAYIANDGDIYIDNQDGYFPEGLWHFQIPKNTENGSYNALTLRNGVFEKSEIHDAKTCSDNLVIRGGRIVCVKDVVIDTDDTHSVVRTQALVYYHRTGKPYRVSNHERFPRRRNYWVRSHGAGRQVSWGDGSAWKHTSNVGYIVRSGAELTKRQLAIGGGYNFSYKRSVNLNIKLKAVHRERWKSIKDCYFRRVYFETTD